MAENELALHILAEFRRQESDPNSPNRVIYVDEDIGDLSMIRLDGDFDLIALARRILETLPPLSP